VAVLLPVKQSMAFMQQLQSSAEMQQHIKGVLFDDTGEQQMQTCVALSSISCCFGMLRNACAIDAIHACIKGVLFEKQ
jgi:hypothetical protein